MQGLGIQDPNDVFNYTPGQISSLGYFFRCIEKDQLQDVAHMVRGAMWANGHVWKSFIRQFEQDSDMTEVPVPKGKHHKIPGFKMSVGVNPKED